MSQSRCFRNVIAAGLLILVVFAAGLRAQSATKTSDDTLLKMVPAESMFCIRVNNFEYTLNQIDQFLTGASPMPMGVSMLVRMQLANLLGSPEPNGVNMNGSMLLFGANLPSESPQTNQVSNMFVGVLFPVTDYKQFIDGNPNCTQPDEKGISKISMNETPKLLATQAGNYALLNWANDYDKLIAYKKLMGLGTGASAETAPLADALDAAEAKLTATEPIWAYGNVQLASKTFGPLLFGKIEELKTTMKNVEAGQQGEMPQNIQNIINMYVSIIETLMKETRSLSIVINPKPNVLRITKTICAVPGTDMANMFVADTVAEQENKLLGYLEDGAMMNFGLRMNATICKKIEKGIELFSTMAGESMTAEDIEKMKTLAADGIDCLSGPVACSMSIDVNDKPPFVFKYYLTVKDEKEFNKFIDEATQMINTSGILDFYKAMGLETSFTIKRDVDRYKDVSIDSAKLTMKSTDPNSMQGQMIHSMYGGGLNYRWGMVDGLCVFAIGGDVDSAIRKLIDQAKEGTPKQSSAELKAALALLPEADKADFMMTFNLLRLFKMATAMAPIPMPQMDIPTKSNIVLAAKAGNGKLVVDFALPKEHLQEIMAVFLTMQQQQQQQMQMQGQPEM